MARLTSELVLSLRDRVSGPARQVGGALNALDRQTKQIGAGLQQRDRLSAQAFGAMGSYAREAAMAAAPLAAGFAAADMIKTTAAFETSLANIAKKGDLSAEALAKVKGEILGMVESGKVAMDPSEIAGAYERGIAAGIPIEKMREFTLLSAQAADAWEMSGSDVGNAFAGFNTTMGVKFEDMRQYADLINSLADAGISDERDIVTFLDNAGAGLKNFGMAKETIAGVGAALLDMKMPAETAARMMGIVSSKLLAPENLSDEAFGTFSDFVGDLDQFKKTMKNDPTKGFVKFMEKLRSLDKFEQTRVLGQIFGAEWSDEIQRMLGGWERVQRNMEMSADPSKWVGSLGKSYEKKLETMESRWKVFTANLEKLKIDLGDMILAPGSNFLGEATAGVNELSRTIDGLKTTWETLKSAVKSAPSKDQGGFNPLDPWGTRAQGDADSAQRKVMKDLAERKPSDPAVGAYGARDTDGMAAAMALAAASNAVRRRTGETYRERKERIYQTTKVRGARAAEAESMQALKEQFGTYLTPDGQAFRPGTDAHELVEEALTEFSGVVLTAAAEIGKATGQPLTGGDLGRATGIIPRPKSRPDGGASEVAVVPTPRPRPDASAPAGAPASVPAVVPAAIVPTPRPDIVGPVTAEGEAAATKATEIGQRITDAFSVTARPHIDTSGLDALISKARAARAELDQLNAATRGLGGRVIPRAQVAEYDSLQNDIED